MPYYAVCSGNVLRCVVADNPKSACVNAVTAHLNDPDTEDCTPGKIFHTAEHGQMWGEQIYIAATHVMKAGNFYIGETD